MTESQFYIRLILNVIVGVMFAYALYKMATNNNQETTPLKHRTMHVFGWIFVGLSCVFLCSCIGYIFIVEHLGHPQQPIGLFEGGRETFTQRWIFHAFRYKDYKQQAADGLYWGYPTFAQLNALQQALASFKSLGIGIYLLYFKCSHSKWSEKVKKFFNVSLLYIFTAAAADFHYFIPSEFIVTLIFCFFWMDIVYFKDFKLNQWSPY